jgi:predicted nucleic acid-binding Zn ribbon protein
MSKPEYWSVKGSKKNFEVLFVMLVVILIVVVVVKGVFEVLLLN